MRRNSLELNFIRRDIGLDHFPFIADLALPSGVFGPVERYHGRQRWIATAWMNLRSGVQPVLAYLESILVGRLFSLKVVMALGLLGESLTAFSGF